MLTAYDAAFAALLEKAGLDCILVGDSLGNVFQGVSSTREVTVDQMVYHTRSVRSGAPNAFVWTDMPHLSYETPETAVANARRLIEAGADGVKLEGYRKGIVRALTDAGIDCYALIAPTMSTLEGREMELMEAIASTGARVVFHDPLNIRNVDTTRLDRMGITASQRARDRLTQAGTELGLTVLDTFENRGPSAGT